MKKTTFSQYYIPGNIVTDHLDQQVSSNEPKSDTLTIRYWSENGHAKYDEIDGEVTVGASDKGFENGQSRNVTTLFNVVRSLKNRVDNATSHTQRDQEQNVGHVKKK